MNTALATGLVFIAAVAIFASYLIGYSRGLTDCRDGKLGKLGMTTDDLALYHRATRILLALNIRARRTHEHSAHCPWMPDEYRNQIRTWTTDFRTAERPAQVRP